jgi:hypothetical protein
VGDRCSHIEARRDCRIVTSSKQSRQYAEDCLRWAHEAKTEEQLTLLLDMAKFWLRAAGQAGGGTNISDEPRPRSVVS